MTLEEMMKLWTELNPDQQRALKAMNIYGSPGGYREPPINELMRRRRLVQEDPSWQRAPLEDRHLWETGEDLSLEEIIRLSKVRPRKLMI